MYYVTRWCSTPGSCCAERLLTLGSSVALWTCARECLSPGQAGNPKAASGLKSVVDAVSLLPAPAHLSAVVVPPKEVVGQVRLFPRVM